MFTKYTIALSALLLFGVSAVAVANEEPEHNLADRYPFLEKITPVASSGFTARNVIVQRNAMLSQFVNEDAEEKIADRYPFLEQNTTSGGSAYAQVAPVQRNAKLSQFVNEDAEEKIADRYPFLEQTAPVVTAAKPAVRTMRIGKGTAKSRKVSLRMQALPYIY